MSDAGVTGLSPSATADIAVLASWQAEDVRPSQALSALTNLRFQHGGLATRTSVVNLVIVTDDDEAARTALEAERRFGSHQPGRTVVLVSAGDGERSGFDADVSICGGLAGGHEVWFEDVVLKVKGPAAAHLHSLIEPFTLPDLPVVVWFPGGLPDPDDKLVDEADVVFVDSRSSAAQTGQLPLGALLGLTERAVVTDLAWVRLEPWRQLMASHFDHPSYRPFLEQVRSAEAAGKPGVRHLLGGWLTSRLSLSSAQVSLSEARHASIGLEAEHGGRMGRFGVTREEGERVVRATARATDTPDHDDLLALPEASLSWSLATALSRLDRDPVYEEALRGAGSLQ